MTKLRTVFTLRLAGKPGQAGIHRLRAVLKELLRRHGLVCLDAREERVPDAPNQIADAFTELRRDVRNRLRKEERS